MSTTLQNADLFD